MSCDCSSSPGLMPFEQALQQLLAQAQPVSATENLPLEQALGRVLAQPVLSAINVPAWDNSAMDGYALRLQDAEIGQPLKISQRIPAGTAPPALEAGTVARIFTGAPVPEGADTVIMQEWAQAEGDQVRFERLPEKGANIRRIGEDIAQGSSVLQPGTRLQPQHLGLAASVGVAELNVYRRLKVAVLASGDELLMPGQPLQPGMIYNSNLFTLSGLLQSLGCEIIPYGQIADNLQATKEALQQAAAEADLVIASGGVSVGEEDHVKPAVEQLGRLELWKIAMRPGKPLAFGFIDQTPFIGTPGNPVSLFVTFVMIARPFILKMMGLEEVLPTSLQAIADFDWPKPDKRKEFHRARLVNGQIQVYPSRSSAVLSSVVWANGLLVIPEGQKIARGDQVEFIPFSELI